jgi:hypothetical protein
MTDIFAIRTITKRSSTSSGRPAEEKAIEQAPTENVEAYTCA